MMQGLIPEFAIVVVVVLAACIAIAIAKRRRLERDFVWRTDHISVSILRDDQYLKIGQFLNLDQSLLPGEGGWTNMKIDIPDQWNIQEIRRREGKIELVLADGALYVLNRRNVGPLSFKILNGGVKSDSELQRLWRRYAQGSAA